MKFVARDINFDMPKAITKFLLQNVSTMNTFLH